MFKKAQYIQQGSVSPNTISTTKTGRLNLNRHVVKRFGIQNNMGAYLYWDESENKIAMVLTEKGRPGSFPLVFVPSGQAAYIIAIQFFRTYKLDPEKYAASYEFELVVPRHLGIEDAGEEAFVIDLKKPIN